MRVDARKLRDIQRKIAKEVKLSDELKLSEIKTVCGFDIAFVGKNVYCAAIVLNIETLEIIETKTSITKIPMQYIPGFLSFREGPAILQTFYELESNPDVLIVDGHGVAHPLKCGLASYVGVELGKPCIGVAKSILVGVVKEDKIIILNETRGQAVYTREHANPVYVSAGNMISLKSSVALVKKMIKLPHKLPEPLHLAHKIAKRMSKQKLKIFETNFSEEK